MSRQSLDAFRDRVPGQQSGLNSMQEEVNNLTTQSVRLEAYLRLRAKGMFGELCRQFL